MSIEPAAAEVVTPSEAPAEPKRSGVEVVKENSRQLRGGIGEELAQDIDHFSDPNKQLLKFHGTYQQEDRDARKNRSRLDDRQQAKVLGVDIDAVVFRQGEASLELARQVDFAVDRLLGFRGQRTEVRSQRRGSFVFSDF